MRTKVIWAQGSGGTGTQYTFSPKPGIIRSMPAQRNAVFEIPNLNGAVVQTLGLATRRIEISGIIYVYPPNFDNLVDAKTNLENGIGTGEGELHIISDFGNTNSRHIYYKGILDGEIKWAEQKNMSFLEYSFTILCADPNEYGYSGYSGYSGIT